MKRLWFILDRLICGKTAAVMALIGAVCLLWIWLQPFPSRHFLNVVRLISASWLYLALSLAIAYSAVAVMAKRPGTATDMWTCVIVGTVWAYTPLLAFLPFNFSRLLMIYGLAGVVAHCIRRSRCDAPPPIVMASIPAKQAGRDSTAQPDRKA